MVKPKIIYRDGRWVCHDEFKTCRTGRTPSSAYFNWLEAFHNRTRIPRHGVWNRRGCNDWLRRGCPQISSYVAGKRIVAYDWKKDELVLQG